MAATLAQSQQKFLIFLHIQKTGGITLQRILRRKLGASLLERGIQLLSNSAQPDSLEASLKAKRMQDRYFVGHICFGVHRFLPAPYTYIAFLREPTSRIISLYTYSQSNPTAYYHKIAVNKSLEDFALNTPLMELDNGQVRFLAGDSQDLFINRTPIGQCTSDLLEIAQKNIDQHFLTIGLTEYFDHSLLLLGKLLGWENCLYLRRNSSREVNKPTVSADLKAEIAKRNWLDIKLYEYARHRMFEQLDQYEIIKDKIDVFQKNNYLFNKYFGFPYTVYDLTKAAFRGGIYRP